MSPKGLAREKDPNMTPVDNLLRSGVLLMGSSSPPELFCPPGRKLECSNIGLGFLILLMRVEILNTVSYQRRL